LRHFLFTNIALEQVLGKVEAVLRKHTDFH
jgi:hypothetical protein